MVTLEIRKSLKSIIKSHTSTNYKKGKVNPTQAEGNNTINSRSMKVKIGKQSNNETKIFDSLKKSTKLINL